MPPVAATMWLATSSSTRTPARVVSSSWASRAESPSSAIRRRPSKRPGASGCVAHGEQRGDPFAVEAAAHERQRHRRLVIDPLRVVDDNEYGLCAGCLLGQAQDGETDAERVERVVLRLPEHGLECGSLRLGQGVDAVEEMQRQLVHGRVPEGHLRFDADDAHDTEVGCDVDRVVDQRRFADASGAGKQDGSGDATLGVTQEPIDDGPFAGAADEEVARRRRWCGIVHARHDAAGSAKPDRSHSWRRPVASTATIDTRGAKSAIARFSRHLCPGWCGRFSSSKWVDRRCRRRARSSNQPAAARIRSSPDPAVTARLLQPAVASAAAVASSWRAVALRWAVMSSTARSASRARAASQMSRCSSSACLRTVWGVSAGRVADQYR